LEKILIKGSIVMKKFRISSPLNLHSASREDISEYIKAGLLFHKEAGFDAADFATGLLDLAGDGWKAQAEKALADANAAILVEEKDLTKESLAGAVCGLLASDALRCEQEANIAGFAREDACQRIWQDIVRMTGK
jgi:hypothetical protein